MVSVVHVWPCGREWAPGQSWRTESEDGSPPLREKGQQGDSVGTLAGLRAES